MTRRPVSLQGRLLALVLAVALVSGGIGMALSYLGAVHEADELFDAQLAQTAQTLLAVADGQDAPDGPQQPLWQPVHPYQQKLLFQLWRPVNGQLRLVLRSASAPLASLPAKEKEFSSVEWHGGSWRFYAETDPDRDTHVVVGQDLAIRRELAGQIAWRNLMPLLAGLPIMGIALLWAIRRGFRPLSTLARELTQRAPSRLDPVRLDDPPQELQAVQAALNDLFGRLAAAMENERRFTADAAHELRTPLAALKAQLQVAQRTPAAADRQHALDQCLRGIERMTHLVSQLLTLARLDARHGPLPFVPLDLSALAASVCADLGPTAVAKGVDLELLDGHAKPVAALAELLPILLNNLVANAIRHTPSAGQVTVAVLASQNGAVLEVRDSGPGVKAENLALLGRRFQRFDDSPRDGVGLGLSIARRIAELHGAELVFAPAREAGGLCVRLCLAAAA